MGRLPEIKMTKEYTQNISPEELLAYLRLPSTDDTQTAFAKKGLHISETTAKKWRDLANEGDVVLIDTHYADPPPKACLFPCCNWLRKRLATRNGAPEGQSTTETRRTRA